MSRVADGRRHTTYEKDHIKHCLNSECATATADGGTFDVSLQ